MTAKTAPASFDFASLDTVAASNAGAEISIPHPVLTGKKSGLFVTILGKDSDTFREHQRDRADADIKRRSILAKTGEEEPLPTAQQVFDNATNLLVICSTGWRQEVYDDKGEVVDNKPTITFEGKELEFSVKNAKLVFSRLLWVRRKVDEQIDNLENFIKV